VLVLPMTDRDSSIGSPIPGPACGDVVTARLRTWPTAKAAATGVLMEVLGPRDAPGGSAKSDPEIRTAGRLPSRRERKPMPLGRTCRTRRERPRDLFDRRVFTIDGAEPRILMTPFHSSACLRAGG